MNAFKIVMSKGDIKWVRFLVNTPDGAASEIDFTNIYFTVKKSSKDSAYIFQKTLKNESIYKLGAGDYQFKIDVSDTAKMIIGDYKFDIQISYRNLLKETFVGDFILEEEITYPENEDDNEEEVSYDLPQPSESSTVILEIPDYHVLQLETPLTITSGGIINYSSIENKPKIAGVTLEGDLSLEELGIQAAGDNLSNDDIDAIIEEMNKQIDGTSSNNGE